MHATLSNVPLLLLQDHDFFQHLEMHMRSEFPPLCGRDHLSFRSYYFPVKVGTWLLRPPASSPVSPPESHFCAERDRRRSVRAVQQHGPPQAEELGRGAGQNAARGFQEAGGHPHSLRLLSGGSAAQRRLFCPDGQVLLYLKCGRRRADMSGGAGGSTPPGWEPKLSLFVSVRVD